MATIFTASDENISLLSRKLLNGEIVAVPTETVYGLAANAYDDAACARVFRAKARPAFDPLIVHLPLGFDLSEIAELTPEAVHLTDTFWPGPLTLVLKKKPIIPDIVTAGLDSVAVRMPRHPVFQRLLAACQKPLAAPSANPFGYVSPTSAQHVQESLGAQIPYILDGGPSEIGLESTILDLRTPGPPTLLRPGALTVEEISKVVSVQIPTKTPANQPHGEVMPGQLSKHYSPHSNCSLVDRISLDVTGKSPQTAFLFFAKPISPQSLPTNVFWLSESGNDVEAAHRLFHLLHVIDERGFASFVSEKVPEHGLGRAINDRLRRAAAVKSLDVST